jgi:hypothetical protein
MDEEIQALITQLADPQFSARKVAVKKLKQHGLAAAPGLRAALNSRNPIVAIYAAQLLGAAGDIESIPALTRRLHGEDAEVRNAVTRALAMLAKRQTSQEAIDRIQKQEWKQKVWQPAPAPTVTISTPPTTDEQLRKRAALGLPDSIEGLIGTLSHADYRRRSAATDALVSHGEAALPALSVVLSQARSPIVQQRAAEAMGRIGSLSALLPLLTVLHQQAREFSPEMNVLIAVRDAVVHLLATPAEYPMGIPEAVALFQLYPQMYQLGLPLSVFAHGAKQLILLAQEQPAPELRATLPYLKGRWPLVPREFPEARKAIEEATKAWADLPIASVEPSGNSADLPVPVAGSDTATAHNLPRPTEDLL